MYLEQLETEPWKYMPEVTEADLPGDVVKVCHYGDLSKIIIMMMRLRYAYATVVMWSS